MLLPFNQCPVHEGGLWAASAQRKAQHGSIVKASSPVMYSHIPSHYIPSSPQWNTITAAVQWLWKEKDIILAQYFPFYSAHAEDQALWIFFFLTLIHQSVWWDRSPGVFTEFFLENFLYWDLCLHVYAWTYSRSSWESIFSKSSEVVTPQELQCCQRLVQLCRDCLLVVYKFVVESRGSLTGLSPEWDDPR